MRIGIEKKEALQLRGLPKILEIMLELSHFNARYGSMKALDGYGINKKVSYSNPVSSCEAYTEESSFPAA